MVFLPIKTSKQPILNSEVSYVYFVGSFQLVKTSRHQSEYGILNHAHIVRKRLVQLYNIRLVFFEGSIYQCMETWPEIKLLYIQGFKQTLNFTVLIEKRFRYFREPFNKSTLT